MATIQSKKKPIIQKGNGLSYIPETFAKEHKVSWFHSASCAEEILEGIKPMEIYGKKIISFDTETHPYFSSSQEVPKSIVRRWVGKGKLATPQDFPFIISVCDGTNAWSLHDSVANDFKEFKKLLPLFEDSSIEKIAHNTKFDMHQFANADMKIIGRLHDTVVLCKLADENRTSFQLRDLAARNPKGIVKFEYMVDTFKQMNKVHDYRMIPRELIDEYANADVWNCIWTFVDEYQKLIDDELVERYDEECVDMIALYSMERHGMPVDHAYEEPLKKDLQNLTDEVEQSIYTEAGKVFNTNSTKQLYDALLSLGVHPSWIPTTDKGNPSLDKDTLNTLASKYNIPLAQKVLEYRKNEKLLGTYAIGIYGQRDAENCVHGSINQTEATTGRMSITKPALQTLPKKDKRIRKAFTTLPGYSLWFMDLDQIEYRLFAHYAKIPSLLTAIHNGYDVHAATAAMIFHVDLDELLFWLNHAEPDKDDPEYDEIKRRMASAADMRGKGKTINFALIYGVGIEHLAELLNCTVTEASELKSHYFAQLPEAKKFIATVHAVIKQRGFVKNYYGRAAALM